jgi:hypothetical protein
MVSAALAAMEAVDDADGSISIEEVVCCTLTLVASIMENDSGEVRLAPMVIRERKDRRDEMVGSILEEAKDGSNECCECEEGVM